jgi:hypothetical protein
VVDVGSGLADEYASSVVQIVDEYGFASLIRIWPEANGGAAGALQLFPDAETVRLELSAVDLGPYRDDVLAGRIGLGETFEGDRSRIGVDEHALGAFALLDAVRRELAAGWSCPDPPILTVSLGEAAFRGDLSVVVLTAEAGDRPPGDSCPEDGIDTLNLPFEHRGTPYAPEGTISPVVIVDVDSSYRDADEPIVLGIAVSADGGGIEVPLKGSAGSSAVYEGLFVAPGTRIAIYRSITDVEPAGYVDLPSAPDEATDLHISIQPGAVTTNGGTVILDTDKVILVWQ